ncbi:hypothetical protein AVEN_78799-1 [Araneus ventricosus]|uniref:Uncharacterized protein n=1 Tax=Araneus ventricosus TaxID=182803 RepID=A0A4Y2HGE4_ARAVE|nr:hypothetical protein AVEN_78799-1 [Araneus ventricosus]
MQTTYFHVGVALVDVEVSFKPGLFGKKRHELDSPNLDGHFPHNSTLVINFPCGVRKWTVVGKDNWTLYRAYLLSDVRTSHPLKRRQPPQTGLRRC